MWPFGVPTILGTPSHLALFLSAVLKSFGLLSSELAPGVSILADTLFADGFIDLYPKPKSVFVGTCVCIRATDSMPTGAG